MANLVVVPLLTASASASSKAAEAETNAGASIAVAGGYAGPRYGQFCAALRPTIREATRRPEFNGRRIAMVFLAESDFLPWP